MFIEVAEALAAIKGQAVAEALGETVAHEQGTDKAAPGNAHLADDFNDEYISGEGRQIIEHFPERRFHTGPLDPPHIAGRADDFQREGMVHSFFAFGRCSVTIDFDDCGDRESVAPLIEELAGHTHTQGLAMVGSIRLCGACGARPKGRVSVCPRCGSEAVYEIERREQGFRNEIVRL